METSATNQSGKCKCSQEYSVSNEKTSWRAYFPVILSFVLLVLGILFDNILSKDFFTGFARLGWYLLAYIPVGFPVIREAFEGLAGKELFTEFTLMSVATVGAFIIGEYPEAVAVMLFYAVGELFQDSAVNKVKRNIKSLLDVRPESANVYRDNKYQIVSPEEVQIGEIIQIKAGEKVPLDGIMLSKESSFNTSALTGESKPKTIREGESVLAGMLNIDKVIEIRVEKEYSDSSLAKILKLVQDAASRKAKTELLIRRFAKIYTPIVFLLALAITLIPMLIVQDYVLRDWLYRALVFLVISCPCALVISIPLGYFGGIGAASKNGILFKGANFLDLMTKVNTIVLDKTGTLTKGVFKVQEVSSLKYEKSYFVNIVATLESFSNHPIAKAITEYNLLGQKINVSDVEEVSGYGLRGVVDNHKVMVGNARMMTKYGVKYPEVVNGIVETIVIASFDDEFAGYITIADEIKEDAQEAIEQMYKLGIKTTVILSGDKTSIVNKVAQQLNITESFGDLLPEDKVAKLEDIQSVQGNIVAFVGDGINDSPALALSDVGIAMGGMGSDAAIEVADVIIQTDQPSKIPTAIRVAKATRRIVFQNIILAFAVKALVLILGAFGIATMWEAVFADVGVALLAILNASRVLYKKFS